MNAKEAGIIFGRIKVAQSNRFSYFIMPNELFVNQIFDDLSLNAKVVYSLLLDRVSLSYKNNWMDEDDNVYIIYAIDDIAERLRISQSTVSRCLDELEKKYGLIERKRLGLGLPNVIYVNDFSYIEQNSSDLSNRQIKNSQIDKSGLVKLTDQDLSICETIHTNTNYTNNNQPNDRLIDSACACESNEQMRVRERELLEEQLDYDDMVSELKTNNETSEIKLANEIFELILDTLCQTSGAVLIGKDKYPVDVVKNKFRQLNQNLILYVIDCVKESSGDIKNIKAYLLTCLFTAASTFDAFSAARELKNKYAKPKNTQTHFENERKYDDDYLEALLKRDCVSGT